MDLVFLLFFPFVFLNVFLIKPKSEFRVFFCFMISSIEIASLFGELGFGSRVLLDRFQVYLPFTKPFSSRETIGVSDLVLEATFFQEMAREIWLTKIGAKEGS